MMRGLFSLLFGGVLALGLLAGCEERRASPDAALDLPADSGEKDAADEPPEVADRLDAPVDGRVDVALDRRDGAPLDAGFDASVDVDADVESAEDADVRDAAADVRDVADGGEAADGSDVTDVGASTVVFRDRPTPLDGPIEGIDATVVDEGAVAFDVLDGCTVPRFGAPYDAGPPCSPGRTRACTCSGDRRGAEMCESGGVWGYCVCASVDAGIAVVDGEVIVPERPIPWIGRPRLLAPQSGMRVTSQRPTLRWMLPSGIERARVELCADRPCVRMLAQQEVRGDRWRPTTALPAGVVFWRVRGLDTAGAVRWTSATWEFGVRRRDLGVDTSYGALKDFNGDGYDDLVTSQGTTRKLVYPGSARGIEAARVVELGDFCRDEPGPAFCTVRQVGVGDFNGDGLADVAIGSIPLGRTVVYFGSRSCLITRTSGVHRTRFFDGGEETGSVSAGDFNGDGYADLITNSYRMEIYNGGPSGPSDVPSNISALTSNVAGFVGDINGDGYQDILSMPVGPNSETYGLPLLVLYGNPEGRLEFHVERLSNPIGLELPTSFQSYFGFVLRWSDLNEDGYMDGLISLPGRVYAYYGSPAGYTWIVRPRTTEVSFGAGLFGNFGGYVAHPADLDGDGHAEVFVSNLAAPRNEITERNGPGRTYVFARDGITGLLDPTPSLTVAAPPRSVVFGKVAAPGDLNGDGYDDLVIGAHDTDRPAFTWLHVYYGGSPMWGRGPAVTFERESAFGNQE